MSVTRVTPLQRQSQRSSIAGRQQRVSLCEALRMASKGMMALCNGGAVLATALRATGVDPVQYFRTGFPGDFGLVGEASSDLRLARLSVASFCPTTDSAWYSGAGARVQAIDPLRGEGRATRSAGGSQSFSPQKWSIA